MTVFIQQNQDAKGKEENKDFLNTSRVYYRTELHFERPHQGPKRHLWSGKCVLRSVPYKREVVGRHKEGMCCLVP